MKPGPWSHLDLYRIKDGPMRTNPGDTFGAFAIPAHFTLKMLRVIASDGLEGPPWEHVSVSLPNRCPNWNEMSQIKELFWLPTETVMQLHVPVADHINDHPFCLHLWRPRHVEIPRPPHWMVGPKPGETDEDIDRYMAAAMGKKEAS